MLAPAAQALVRYLQDQGASTSAQLQVALHKSQPTVSRLLASVPDQVLVLGRGRSARYALPQPIGGASAQQPLWLVDDQGQLNPVGLLSLLAKGQVHVAAEGMDTLYEAALPWFLSPLRAEGFLGRLLAQQLASQGVNANPALWDVATVLQVALQLHDAPGALVLGHAQSAEPVAPKAGLQRTLPATGLATVLDALAGDVANTLPAGSSAGGEQPKFLATLEGEGPVLVKFSPPRGTPFGERWHDLLHAEATSSAVLQGLGVAVAPCQVVESATRTYLLSQRFDRVGSHGRKHVVALGAVHAAFVPGRYEHWAATCDALARQGRLGAQDAQRVLLLLQFGQLVGNTDMHSGNLSLFAHGSSLREIAKGHFSLAPLYDMLPMRWRPDPVTGTTDYSPFEVMGIRSTAEARGAAMTFWTALSEHAAVSTALREVAAEMARRTGVA